MQLYQQSYLGDNIANKIVLISLNETIFELQHYDSVCGGITHILFDQYLWRPVGRSHSSFSSGIVSCGYSEL